MVETLSKLSTKPDQLKFAVVPFAEYVNVGMGNRTKSWLSVPNDYQDPPRKECHKSAPVTGKSNCRKVWVPPSSGSAPGTCYNDGVPYSCGGSQPKAGHYKEDCDYTYGRKPRPARWCRAIGTGGMAVLVPAKIRSTPRMAITARRFRADGYLVQRPIARAFGGFRQGEVHDQGPDPERGTYIPAGLVWGWRTLSPQEPFTAAANTSSEPVRKFLVLMTDGLNTKSPTYPEHWGTDTAKSNTLVKQICANIALTRRTKSRSSAWPST